MARVATSFSLSLWLGFHAVTGFSELAGLTGVQQLFGVDLEPVAGSNLAASALLVSLSLGLAAATAFALLKLQSSHDADVRNGEVMAFGTVGISAAAVLSALLMGGPFEAVFDRLDLAFWCVALTLVALVFDGAIYAAEDPDDEIAFRKALLAIDTSNHRDAAGTSGSSQTEVQ